MNTPMSYMGGVRRSPWIGRAVFVVVLGAVVYLPTFLDDPTRTRQWAEYLCYAALAVGIDIAWGYGGMLVLGQGLFFGLGAYAMGMHLSLEQVEPGQMPSFMALYGDQTELPLIWKPFENLWVSVVLALFIPMLIAGAFGWLVFSRRVRGPYFAVLSQAMALIFTLIMVGQLKTFAGTNGLTDFQQVFGRNKYEPDTNRFLYFVAAGVLLVVFLGGRHLVRSRYGRLLVAVRDREDRVRFLGYNPAVVKTFAFVVAAAMAGAAGAIAAPIIGIVAPNQFGTLPSILMVCWVAVGGRGTLYGAIIGAIFVNWGGTAVSEQWPDTWQYLQGLLFIVVVAFIPGGIVGLFKLVGQRLPSRRGADPVATVIPPPLDPLVEAAS
ncbi:MAG: urea ABC transporter permease subunit UrtC [Ilumatobacteraceae bacterium]